MFLALYLAPWRVQSNSIVLVGMLMILVGGTGCSEAPPVQAPIWPEFHEFEVKVQSLRLAMPQDGKNGPAQSKTDRRRLAAVGSLIVADARNLAGNKPAALKVDTDVEELVESATRLESALSKGTDADIDSCFDSLERCVKNISLAISRPH